MLSREIYEERIYILQFMHPFICSTRAGVNKVLKCLIMIPLSPTICTTSPVLLSAVPGTFFLRVHANRDFKLTLVNDNNNNDGELASVKRVMISNNRVEVRISPRPSTATTATNHRHSFLAAVSYPFSLPLSLSLARARQTHTRTRARVRIRTPGCSGASAG